MTLRTMSDEQRKTARDLYDRNQDDSEVIALALVEISGHLRTMALLLRYIKESMPP